jgi:hypothetical protein
MGRVKQAVDVAVDEFIRGQIAPDCTADYDYDGGFGDDDDLSDQRPEDLWVVGRF